MSRQKTVSGSMAAYLFIIFIARFTEYLVRGMTLMCCLSFCSSIHSAHLYNFSFNSLLKLPFLNIYFCSPISKTLLATHISISRLNFISSSSLIMNTTGLSLLGSTFLSIADGIADGTSMLNARVDLPTPLAAPRPYICPLFIPAISFVRRSKLCILMPNDVPLSMSSISSLIPSRTL